MQLFVNNTPVSFLRGYDEIGSIEFKSTARAKDTPSLADFSGKTLIKAVDHDRLYHYVNEIMLHEYRKVSFYFIVEEYDKAKQSILDRFKVIDAAGGVVTKGDLTLMIYRFKKWDLPKGKLEKHEKFRKCAVREVEEETGLRVRLTNKVCTTWHTYTLRRKRILKKTKWYAMDCLDDSHMAPQYGESIERVEWMTDDQVSNALKTSYKSIKYVIKNHRAMADQPG
jgi:ADP-ribose pyrophosphatase YjhB (NUDIX family)